MRILVFTFNCNKSSGIDDIRAIDVRRDFDLLKEALFSILNGIIEKGFVIKAAKLLSPGSILNEEYLVALEIIDLYQFFLVYRQS